VIASCRADAKSVETAVEAYKAQNGGNPPSGFSALIETNVVGGQTVGPWLQAVPNSSHYTILIDGQGNVYVYPPRTDALTQLDNQHNFDMGDPCAMFATY